MPKIDIDKRRRVMQRSQKLGHCICDPRRPCPCDVFTQRGLCPCAGERPEPASIASVRLTQLVHNAGCASKIAPTDLEAVLGKLPPVNDPAIISGIPAADDAAIYRLNDTTLLVQTVDVMTPCVDDPYLFGRICAANCLSDIYAMGGVPRTALSILAFPSETLDGQIMYQMMKGATDVLNENGCSLIGGHSIKDDEIKLGFAITGTVEQPPSPASVAQPPSAVGSALKTALRHDTARPGDILVLTKPLGVGVVNFAQQVGWAAAPGAQGATPAASAGVRGIGRANTAAHSAAVAPAKGVDVAAAQRWMAQVNRAAAQAARAADASACTDVTGFGLLGHLLSMLRHSQVSAEIDASALPAIDGVLEALRDGVVPGAVERNMEYVGDDLQADGVEPALVHLAADAQTSGGLLIAVPQERYERLLNELAERDVPAFTIGRVTAPGAKCIVMRAAGATTPSKGQAMKEAKNAKHSADCCADVFGQSAVAPAGGVTTSPVGRTTTESAAVAPSGLSTVAASCQAFGSLMRSMASEGAIDEKTKELIIFALVVHSRCGPCFEHHYRHALELGLTMQQLDEAAWCAIAMGGAPVKMFYQRATESERDA